MDKSEQEKSLIKLARNNDPLANSKIIEYLESIISEYGEEEGVRASNRISRAIPDFSEGEVVIFDKTLKRFIPFK